jgi:hypothetical protein
MKQIIFRSVVGSLLISTNLIAISVEERITTLENEIKSLKEAKNQIEEIDERVEGIETKTLVDKVSLGLGMRVEMNNLKTTYAKSSDNLINEDPIFRTKFYLNMKAEIADNLKFTGRLSSYKNWGDSNENQTGMASMDAKQGRYPDNSSALFVERAYLDWSLNKGDAYPLTLTLGRQPSSDGPSYQIKEETTRKGTYDALAFDGAADGAVLTADISKIFHGTTTLRVAYGTPNNGSDYNTTMKDTTVTGLFLDKTCSHISQEHLIQIYTVNAKDLMGLPSLGGTDKNIGDLDINGAMFEIQDIDGFDFFVHYAQSRAKPNGKTITFAGQNVGLLSGGGVTTTDGASTAEALGNAIWLGTQYSIDNDWSIGAEYNKGSKNWFSFTFSSNDPMNKLATRGTATELYLSKKINKFANVRLGYVGINYDYSGSGSWLGTPNPISSGLATKEVKEVTNTYLTFNVLF